MADIKLDLLIIDTHSPLSIAVGDFSIYPTNYTPVSPTLLISASGFPEVTLEFNARDINIITSENLGITCSGECLVPLPDGIYKLKYTINPAHENYVEKTFLKVDLLLERYDAVFMQLDMMECDEAISYQKKVELEHISLLIQGAVAAANNCADKQALKLYAAADKQLKYFKTNKCNCHG